MNEGFIKLHRKIRDSWIFRDKKEWFHAWIWMILEAEWKDQWLTISGRGIFVKRGQLAAPIRYLVRGFNGPKDDYWTISKVQYFMKRLQKEGMIKTEICTNITLVTICNYDTYNNLEDKSRTKVVRSTPKSRTQNSTQSRTPKSNDNQSVKNTPPYGLSDTFSYDTPEKVVHKYKEEEIKKRGIEFLKNDRLSSRLHDMGAERFDSQIREVVDYFNDYVGRNASIDYGAWKPLRETVEHLSSGRTTSEIKSAILASLQPLKQDDPSMRSATSAGVVPGDVNEFNKLAEIGKKLKP